MIVLGFASIAVFGWPLVPVVLVLAPLAVVLAAVGRRT